MRYNLIFYSVEGLLCLWKTYKEAGRGWEKDTEAIEEMIEFKTGRDVNSLLKERTR